MVLERIPRNKDGEMYGITFDLDTHILEDELHIDRKSAYKAVERCLTEIGYVHVQHSVYVCPHPKASEILVVHDTIEALKGLDWFSQAVNRVIAFELRSWGDLLESFKQ